jgi:MFS family permease
MSTPPPSSTHTHTDADANVETATAAAAERRLLRRIDRRLLPWLSLLYLLSFLDRANLGNAHTALQRDLHLSDAEYSLAVGAFFIGYVLCELPSNLLLRRATPRKWLARIVVSWGAATAAAAAVSSFTGLVVARCALGIAEAGFFPAMVLYLTMWYRNREQSLRLALVYAAAALAGSLGGILAFGILRLDGAGGLGGWQWLFIIEGVPSILAGIVTWFYLPNDPQVRIRLGACESTVSSACSTPRACSCADELWSFASSRVASVTGPSWPLDGGAVCTCGGASA